MVTRSYGHDPDQISLSEGTLPHTRAHSLEEASVPVVHAALGPADKPTLPAPAPSSPPWRGQPLPQFRTAGAGWWDPKERVSAPVAMEQPACSKAASCHLAFGYRPCKPPALPT